LWNSNISETIFPKKYWNQLEVAPILGINYSPLKKQEKKLSEEVVALERIVWLDIINQKNYSASRSAGVHRRDPADFLKLLKFIPDARNTSIQLHLEAQP
jgi:hypothetical protein